MSKAADLARTASASETALSNRNLMINGDMQIFQRATAATAGANTYQTADRWIILEFSSGAFTSEKYTMSLAELNTTGHGQALELNVTTADTSIGADEFCAVRQVIEAQNLQQLQYGTAAAKDLTLSFWVKSKIAGIYCAQILKVDSTTYFLPVEYTINSVDTWEYKTITFTPTAGSTSLITNSGGVITNDNNAGMQVTFGLVWGSDYHGTNNTWTSAAKYATSNQVNWMSSTSNDFYLAGVQLEVGSVATDFEHRSFGEELALCQRYYTQSTSPLIPYASGTFSFYSFLSLHGSSNAYLPRILFPTTMRANPTCVVGTMQSYNGSSWSNWTNTSSASKYPDGFTLGAAGGFSGTFGLAYLAQTDWTADAEL